jgi:arylsulfatase A-like enzyme
MAEDTVVVFFSDHRTPDKATLYEGGVPTPAMIRWPGGIPGGQVCEELMQNLDIAPTLYDICGIAPPDDLKLDGRSLMPMLAGDRDSIHDELFFESGRTRAVCTRRWKYLALRYAKPPETEKERYHGALQWLQAHSMLRHPRYFDGDQLYDLVNDPEETTNLAEDHPEILRDLRERMSRWLDTFGDHPFGEL